MRIAAGPLLVNETTSTEKLVVGEGGVEARSIKAEKIRTDHLDAHHIAVQGRDLVVPTHIDQLAFRNGHMCTDAAKKVCEVDGKSTVLHDPETDHIILLKDGCIVAVSPNGGHTMRISAPEASDLTLWARVLPDVAVLVTNATDRKARIRIVRCGALGIDAWKLERGPLALPTADIRCLAFRAFDRALFCACITRRGSLVIHHMKDMFADDVDSGYAIASDLTDTVVFPTSRGFCLCNAKTGLITHVTGTKATSTASLLAQGVAYHTLCPSKDGSDGEFSFGVYNTAGSPCFLFRTCNRTHVLEAFEMIATDGICMVATVRLTPSVHREVGMRMLHRPERRLLAFDAHDDAVDVWDVRNVRLMRSFRKPHSRQVARHLWSAPPSGRFGVYFVTDTSIMHLESDPRGLFGGVATDSLHCTGSIECTTLHTRSGTLEPRTHIPERPRARIEVAEDVDMMQIGDAIIVRGQGGPFRRGEIRVHRCNDAVQLARFEGHREADQMGSEMDALPCGAVVTLSGDSTALVFERSAHGLAQTWKLDASSLAHEGVIGFSSVCFAGVDASRVAVACRQRRSEGWHIRVYSTATGACVWKSSDARGNCRRLTWVREGTYLFDRGNGVVATFHTNKGGLHVRDIGAFRTLRAISRAEANFTFVGITENETLARLRGKFRGTAEHATVSVDTCTMDTACVDVAQHGAGDALWVLTPSNKILAVSVGSLDVFSELETRGSYDRICGAGPGAVALRSSSGKCIDIFDMTADERAQLRASSVVCRSLNHIPVGAMPFPYQHERCDTLQSVASEVTKLRAVLEKAGIIVRA